MLGLLAGVVVGIVPAQAAFSGFSDEIVIIIASAPVPLDCAPSDAHSYGCPLGPDREDEVFDNLSFLDRDRVDNLLKAHI